ncbi:hypothetical protein [Methylobacterium crusticola]|uniref:hypothetical protein n=1 Tax=Methylobacterium crusticola TaxID=1697972 RepID=UPI000FFBC0DC|nr:hypothetical protein [Methylobacterium crusticola]
MDSDLLQLPRPAKVLHHRAAPPHQVEAPELAAISDELDALHGRLQDLTISTQSRLVCLAW